MNEIIKFAGKEELQKNYSKIAEHYLEARLTNNEEFKANFAKTFGDLIFSQTPEMLDKLAKTTPNTLLNAVFLATEIGASFAKKEVYFVPFEVKGSGAYSATLIFDINFQRQLMLKMPHCKRFFTAEVHEGVNIVQDLTTGRLAFEGKNDVTKSTVGYYASFECDNGEVYDLFMSNEEIKSRAAFSPMYKPENYKNPKSNIHYEKIVIRNLMKLIPKVSNELKNLIASEEIFSEYENVTEDVAPETNRLEEAKKQMAANGKVAKEEEAAKEKAEPPANEPEEKPEAETSKKEKVVLKKATKEAGKQEERFF